jgi:hypothetical protein
MIVQERREKSRSRSKITEAKALVWKARPRNPLAATT